MIPTYEAYARARCWSIENNPVTGVHTKPIPWGKEKFKLQSMHRILNRSVKQAKNIMENGSCT